MKNKKQSAPSDLTKEMLVNVVLDRSGSMSDCREKTVEGYNEYLNALRTDKESSYNITLIQFDHNTKGCDLTVNYEDKPLKEISDFSLDDYVPRGSTPLLDAIGECVRRVEAKSRAVINVIITDGHENASHEFTKDDIRALIKQKESEGQTFVFLGADIDAFADADSMGMSYTSTANYSKSRTQAAYAATADSTLERARAARTVGVVASSGMSFFQDEQRLAMVDDPAKTGISGVSMPPGTNVVSSVTGGRPAAPAKFSSKPATKKVERKPREWNSTKA